MTGAKLVFAASCHPPLCASSPLLLMGSDIHVYYGYFHQILTYTHEVSFYFSDMSIGWYIAGVYIN